MWSRRRFVAAFGIIALAGCTGAHSNDVVYGVHSWPFQDDEWLYYYDEGDDYFFSGLSDEQKDELRQRWEALSPDEKQQIRDQWNELSVDERSRVRQAWSSLGLNQRQQVISSMDRRARNRTLLPVMPLLAGPSRFQAGHSGNFDLGPSGVGTDTFDRDGFGGRGRIDRLSGFRSRGSFGGRGGRGGLGGRR